MQTRNAIAGYRVDGNGQFQEALLRDRSGAEAPASPLSALHARRPDGQPPLSRWIRPVVTGDVEEAPAIRKVLIFVPEDLEQILKSMIERDPDKGAELLIAGFETRLAELYQQW